MTVITSERTPISAVAPLKVALFWLGGRLFSIASEGRPILKGQWIKGYCLQAARLQTKSFFAGHLKVTNSHSSLHHTSKVYHNGQRPQRPFDFMVQAPTVLELGFEHLIVILFWTFLKFEPIGALIMAYIFKATTVDTIQVKIFLTKALH